MKIAIIHDYKFGRLEPSWNHIQYQMRMYALGKFQGDKTIGKVIVRVYAPRIAKEWLGVYYREQIKEIETSINEVIYGCEYNDALLFRPGAHCKFCRAQTSCVTLGAWLRKQESTEMAPVNIHALTSPQLSRSLEFAYFVENWAKQFKQWAKELSEEELKSAGWEIKETKGRRNIPDLLDAWGLLRRDYDGVLAESDIWPIVSVPYSKLEKLFCEKLVEKEGIKKLEARRRFEETLSAIVKRGKPSRTLVKKEVK